MSALKLYRFQPFNTAGLNIVWILVGLIAIYAGIKNLLDEENPSESEQPFSGVRSVLLQHLAPGFRPRFPVSLLLLCVCRRSSRK